MERVYTGGLMDCPRADRLGSAGQFQALNSKKRGENCRRRGEFTSSVRSIPRPTDVSQPSTLRRPGPLIPTRQSGTGHRTADDARGQTNTAALSGPDQSLGDVSTGTCRRLDHADDAARLGRRRGSALPARAIGIGGAVARAPLMPIGLTPSRRARRRRCGSGLCCGIPRARMP